jgi:hypothetical protein
MAENSETRTTTDHDEELAFLYQAQRSGGGGSTFFTLVRR